ncbi:hydantoinase B/oxoprolinase family protein [Roseomonas sp. F4]
MSADPIRIAILARALQAAAAEMGVNLIRSAFSTVVREAQDCSAALLDPEGQVVAQAEMIPMQTSALGRSFAAAREQLDLSAIGPNHAIIMNDPYSGGQHLNDIIIFQPIFLDDELLGWTGNTAHHLDIGGGTAGVNILATELLAEGLVIPPILFELGRDWPGGAVERLIFANTRTAEIGRGDIDAQLAANHLGIRRVREMAEREGVPVLRQAMREVLDYSERRMRAAITAFPDGTWTGEAVVDRDTLSEGPILVRATVTVQGDSVTVDFAGSAPQVRGMFNCPVASASAAAFTALRNVLADHDMPANDGCNRPLTLIFPEGSVVNPNRGAPVRARMLVAYRALDAIHAALAQAAPRRVPAQGFNTTTGFYIAQSRPNGVWRVYVDVLGGGYGAAPNYDGADATDGPLASCRNTPIESIEQVYPHLRMESYALLPDSGGAGEWRGGLGFCRAIRILEEGVFLNHYSDHYAYPPRGIAGGADGSCGFLRVRRGDQLIELPAAASFPLLPGDLVELGVGGGAGWGDPARRDPALVRRDLENGRITPDYAARHHSAG